LEAKSSSVATAERAQRPAQTRLPALLLDGVEPGKRRKTGAGHGPLLGGVLNTVQVSAPATATMAEVIWATSSGVQIYGGIA
jgi:hypothetical protein